MTRFEWEFEAEEGMESSGGAEWNAGGHDIVKLMEDIVQETREEDGRTSCDDKDYRNG